MNHFAKLVVVVSTAALVLTVVEPASAAVKQVTTHTQMTVSDKSIHKGEVVKFKVRLKAGVAKCFKQMPIQLLKNGNQVGQKTTNNKGKVVFKKHPKKTAKWQARFPGKKTGNHPNRKNCLPSASKKIKITVKKH
jgi:hypothetical protein